MITKYLHIGYPKNFSTSLQRNFFATHPEVFHLGIGCHNSNIKYVSPEVSSWVEMYIRYSKRSIYSDNAENIKSSFLKYFKLAEEKKYKAVGISAEILSLGYSPNDVDVYEKANRLFKIFGPNTQVIIIIRNQFDLLKSFYSECVRNGYPYSFQIFFDFQYKYHFSTFSSDFCYDKTINYYSNLFGKKNIKVLVFEEMINNLNRKLLKENDGSIKLLSDLCKILRLNYMDLDFKNLNNSLTEAQIVEKVKLNKLFPHDISNITYDFIESHRLNDFFEYNLKIDHYQKPLFKDVLTKRKLIKISTERATKNKNQKIDFSMDKTIYKRFFEMYSKSNSKLQEIISKDLSKYNYPLI